MKVLSGTLRGRSFKQPATTLVRPLSEKVRAAIFDVVGNPENLIVLDAYAGSGGAGFEAASRGAILVDAIEANARIAKIISENAEHLGLEWGYVLHQMTVETWLASPAQQPPAPRYNLIIADPPYAKLEEDIVTRLTQYLLPDGVLALSHSSRLPSPNFDVPLAKSKTYGDTTLSFYKVR